MKHLVIDMPTEVPIQQGSKVMVPRRGTRPCRTCDARPMVLVEAANMRTKAGEVGRLDKFRERVCSNAMYAAEDQGWEMNTTGVDVTIGLIYERPVSHVKKNGSLRKGKPVHKVSMPDLDKILRSVNDALAMAGIFDDDSRVVGATIVKHYAKPGQVHGVYIEVRETAMGLAGLL